RADLLKVLAALADVDRHGDHLGPGLLRQVRDGHRRVQPTGICQNDPIGHGERFPSSRPAQADSLAASRWPLVSPGTSTRATTRMVSSPAIVPTTSGRPDRSSALARNCAAPGGVRNTTRLPLASTPVSSSRSRRTSRAGACSAGRIGPPPSGGTTYTAGP